MGHEVTISVGDERGHFLIPGILDLGTPQIILYSMIRAFSLRSLPRCAVMHESYDG